METGRSQHQQAVAEGQAPVQTGVCAGLQIGAFCAQISDDAVTKALVTRKAGLVARKIASAGCKIVLVSGKIATDGCFSGPAGEQSRLDGCFSAQVGELFGFSPRQAGFSPGKTALAPRKTGFCTRKSRDGALATTGVEVVAASAGRTTRQPRHGAARWSRRVPTLRQLISAPRVRRGRPAPRIAGSHTKVPPPGFRSTVFK